MSLAPTPPQRTPREPTSPLNARQSLALVWRTLRSMRTALILLMLLALAAVGGSLLPQIPNSPERVSSYLLDHPFLGDLFYRAGLFDVFGSWWFVLITVLLFTSLVACLLPRTRQMLRAIRQRPIQAREIEAFRHYQERLVAAPPDRAIASSRIVLRRRFFRVACADGQPALAADKGMLREIGSLLFHWAFLLLVVGVIVGKGTGYTGRAVVVEGQTWVDAAANYDGQVRAGRFFSDHFSGAGVRLVDFEDSFRRSGVPMDFTSHVQLLDRDGNVVRDVDIRVNHPAHFAGLRIFQYGFGWAAVVNVHRGSRTIASGPVVLGQDTAPKGVSQLAMPWRGFVKLPTLRPQVAVRLELWPDSRAFIASVANGTPQPMIEEHDPFIRYTVWRGVLNDPSRSALDTSLMHRVGNGVIGEDQTVDLARGCVVAGSGQAAVGADACTDGSGASRLTMSFPGVRQYSVLQVSRDVGVPLVFAAAILILVGLLPSLYTSRRKVWIRAEANGKGTVLKVGGFALQRKGQFEEEFAKLVDALAAASTEVVEHTDEKVGAP
jgi:cytochrome c biogenesis protein